MPHGWYKHRVYYYTIDCRRDDYYTTDRRKCRRNASTRLRSVAVAKPLHAGEAYISLDTTTALKTVCRPTSFIPWCRRTRRAYRDCALSLMTRRMWSDADKLLLRVTPRTLSENSRTTPVVVVVEIKTQCRFSA